MAGTVARMNPAAAKDVSMAGIVGTLGMLAEAGSCAAVLDVAAVPRPPLASVGDWLSCFPGFAMLTSDHRARTTFDSASPATSAICGELVEGNGVRLRWPDGELTPALSGSVTGLGPADVNIANGSPTRKETTSCDL
jgi:selenophosphate synthetase-related protein